LCTLSRESRWRPGPAVGRGNRWRHQIAVAPFGPNGELELAEVLTPHIGGIAGFYRMDGDSLNLVAQQDSVTSHSVVSRNFDMGLAGDLDGDGQPEQVVFDSLSGRSSPCAARLTGSRLLGGRPLAVKQ